MSQDVELAEYVELERLYSEDPDAYRGRVKRLVWLGYGYIAACLAVILGFLVGGGALFATGTLRLGFADEFLRIGLPAAAVAAMMIRAVFVRIPPPEGHYLSGDLIQAVLDWVEPLREATGGCRIDDVVVVDDLNAAVQQRPKWGIFGPSQNSLILGIPLLHLLDADELKAVIAHEFGHLSHAHGRMGATIYRLDHTLANAAQAISEKANTGLAQWTFKFFRWFYPRFDKVTFAMRRGQEYEADRVAAGATNADAIAASLCRLHAVGSGVNAYWGQVWQKAADQPDNVDVRPHQAFAETVRSLIDEAVVAESIQSALDEETGFADTHPCLRDRLAALEVKPSRRVLPSAPSFDAIFSSSQKKALLTTLDGKWQISTRAGWHERHQEFCAAAEKLSTLRSKRDSLDQADLLELAMLEETIEGEGVALATLEQLARRFPESGDARFHLGRLRFQDDPAGSEAAFLECVERDIEWIPNVMQFMRYKYEREGADITASPFARYAEEFESRVERANDERESVNADDAFVVPGLDPAEKARFLEIVSDYPEIRRLELLEKEAEQFKQNRLFVLGIQLNTFHNNVEVNEEKWVARVSPILSEALPVPNAFFTILLNEKSPWLETFANAEGALLYEAEVSGLRRTWEAIKTTFQILTFLIFVLALGYLGYTWLIA
jgi:Zn-dependent protease with chaperone function